MPSQGILEVFLLFYQPRSGMVMQNCRSKEKRELWFLAHGNFIVCLVLNFWKVMMIYKIFFLIKFCTFEMGIQKKSIVSNWNFLKLFVFFDDF